MTEVFGPIPVHEISPKKESERRGKLAWVLSPGFLRGWLQFGVMDRLGKMGLNPDIVVGSSIGAWVGYVAGATRTPVEFIEEMQRREPQDARRMFMKRNFLNRGLFDLDYSIQILGRIAPQYRNFEDLPVPFYVVATRNGDFEPVIFSKGAVLPAIKASVSVPPYFPPTEIDGVEYLDGGLTNPAPIDVALANGATHVIFIDSYTEKIKPKKQKTVESLAKPVELALRVLPGIRPYIGAKGLIIGWPTFRDAPKWVLAAHNQLVKRSVEANPPDVHINLSQALNGDSVVPPLSNHSFEKHSDYIEKGRRAVDVYVSDLRRLKDKLHASDMVTSGKGAL